MQLIHVVQIFCVGAVEVVVLQNDVLGQSGGCRADATGRGEVCLACGFALFEVAHFEYGPVHLSHESVAQLLCHLREVDVVVGNLAHVHVLAEVAIGGIGGTIADGLCVGKVTVGTLSGRSTSEDAYLKLAACLVFGEGNLGQLFSHGLGGS